MLFVKYVGNADRLDSTSKITFSDGRPDIEKGGKGEVSDAEYAGLSGRGLVLEVTDDGGLSKMKVADLKSLAKDHDVEGADDLHQADLVSAIRARMGAAPPLVIGPDSDAEPEQVGAQGESQGTTSTGSNAGVAAGPASATPAGSRT